MQTRGPVAGLVAVQYQKMFLQPEEWLAQLCYPLFQAELVLVPCLELYHEALALWFHLLEI